MEERGAAHRADLAVAEEPAKRHVTQLVAEQVGVVVGLAVEVFAPAQT